ncbi:replication initiator protein A [Priestia megaterium]
MSKKRINIKDVIKQEFYQLPKIILWNKNYREGLSDGAKLLYMIIRDRFSLSVHTSKLEVKNGNDKLTFADKEGNVFCILDNGEIEFTLNKSKKTAIKCIDELIEFELISIEEVEGGAHRIYLNELDSSGTTLATFIGEKDYYKHVQSRKKKGKKPSVTLEEYIAAAEKRLSGEDPSTRGGKNAPPRDGSDTPPGDEKSTPLGDGKNAPPGVENLHPNKKDSKDLESSETYANKTELNESSSNDEEPSGLEEEQPMFITVDNNYALLESIKPIHEICKTQKDINVIKKALIEAKIEGFYKSDVLNAIGSHPRHMQAYRDKGEAIRYEPAFFANNLVDRIISNAAERQAKAEKEAKKVSQQPLNSGRIPFYNFLEE